MFKALKMSFHLIFTVSASGGITGELQHSADLIEDGAVTPCCSQTCIPDIFPAHSLFPSILLDCPVLTHILTMATLDVNNTCPSSQKTTRNNRQEAVGRIWWLPVRAHRRLVFTGGAAVVPGHTWAGTVYVFVRWGLCLQVRNQKEEILELGRRALKMAKQEVGPVSSTFSSFASSLFSSFCSFSFPSFQHHFLLLFRF